MYNYENFLPNKNEGIKHIAIIPDGGRRWAKRESCSYEEAYNLSMKKIIEFIDLAFSNDVEMVSLYMASTYNFSRTEKEVSSFCTIEWDNLESTFLEYALNNNCEIRIIGVNDLNMKPYIEKKDKVEMLTKNGKHIINFCFNYSSFREMEYAINKSTSEECFLNNLQIAKPVNMLIRTGGAKVLSGFMLPQIGFARLFFFDELFNDLTVDDFRECIEEYLQYELKYGE